MTLPSDYDIAIIGAGPVGLFMANLMGLAGVATARAPGSIPLERPKQIVARADAMLYLHLARPDLDKATKFLTDFGLLPAARQGDTVHFRGVGENPVIYSVTRAKRPALLSVGLSVPDRASLLALAKERGAVHRTLHGSGWRRDGAPARPGRHLHRSAPRPGEGHRSSEAPRHPAQRTRAHGSRQ